MLAGVDIPKLDKLKGKPITVSIATLDEETRQFTLEMPTRVGSGSLETWRMLADAFTRQAQVTGTIVAGGWFGYSVKVEDLLTYVPFAEFEASERDTKGAFIGRSLKFCIPKFSATKRDVVLSRLFKQFATWQPFLAAWEKDEPISGTVVGFMPGGFKVRSGERTLFVAFADMDTGWSFRKEFYLGKAFLFKVTELSWSLNRITLSRHQPLEERKGRDAADPLTSQFEPGRVIPVSVMRITDWGVFVDLGGVVGLIHISDLSWLQIGHPSEVVAVGDKLDVVILHVDRQRQRVKLGLKQLSVDPVPMIVSALEIGQIHHG